MNNYKTLDLRNKNFWHVEGVYLEENGLHRCVVKYIQMLALADKSKPSQYYPQRVPLEYIHPEKSMQFDNFSVVLRKFCMKCVAIF